MGTRLPNHLRDTPDAETWLGQFDAADRSGASLLIDSLSLVDSARFDQSLQALIVDEAGKQKTKRATGIYATREVESKDSPTVDGAEMDVSASLKEWVATRGWRPRYFDPKARSRSPDAAPGSKVGSEAYIAHLIRDVAAGSGRRKLLSHPSIHQLRTNKCQNVFLVDDIIGSGRRSETFVTAFCNDPSIRSWMSGGFLRVVVLAYGGTSAGMRRVEQHRFVDKVRVVRLVAAGRAAWSATERRTIEFICRKYAPRTSKPRMPLGYRDAFTLMVFQHDVPNTTPAILWARSPDWLPLLHMRPNLGQSSWPLPEDVNERRKRVLAAMGRTKPPTGGDFERHLEPGGLVRLVVLAASARRIRKIGILSDVAELSIDETARIISQCTALGWLSPDGTITPEGLAELRYARRLGLSPAERPPLRGEPYYPTALRT